MTWLLAIAIAYLAGSIPFGVLIARTRGVNIREHGSRNIGATNVGRVLGRKFGLTCFFLDFLKGAVPVLGAGAFHGVLGQEEIAAHDAWYWTAVALATVVGHMASIYLRFAGGKGVATTFGALVAMWPLLTIPTLGALLTWVVIVRITRYVSCASIAAAMSIPIIYLGIGLARGATVPLAPLVVTVALAALVIWRHRSNLARLRAGTEPKIGSS